MSPHATSEPHARDGHCRVTYEDIHLAIGATAKRIKAEFNPDIMVAIGGGGFFPARVLVRLPSRPRRENTRADTRGVTAYVPQDGTYEQEHPHPGYWIESIRGVGTPRRFWTRAGGEDWQGGRQDSVVGLLDAREYAPRRATHSHRCESRYVSDEVERRSY